MSERFLVGWFHDCSVVVAVAAVGRLLLLQLLVSCRLVGSLVGWSSAQLVFREGSMSYAGINFSVMSSFLW